MEMAERLRPPIVPETPFVPEKINGDFEKKHIISITQFDADSIMIVIALAKEMAKIVEKREVSSLLHGIEIQPIFPEASTRTNKSFESAARRLGGMVLNAINNLDELSIKKGETIEHTVRALEANAVDIIIARHKDENFIYELANAAKRSTVINGGNGGKDHPSQGLLDLATCQVPIF